MKKILLIIIFSFSFNSFSCEVNNNNSNKSLMEVWIGNNSNFSKAYSKGKCALDRALNDISAEERRVIANLIAKTYAQELESLENLKTYNY
ncbi:MAG: hypothetical protein VXW97_01150 [Pseudomonadota bacterium]|nr:hypothetical protein [Pseudomonadota bacterium]